MLLLLHKGRREKVRLLRKDIDEGDKNEPRMKCFAFKAKIYKFKPFSTELQSGLSLLW